MVEQVVGLRFVVDGEAEATAKLKTFQAQQEKVTNSIKNGAGIAKRLENDIKSLNSALGSGTISQKAFNSAITQVTRSYKMLNEGVRGTSMSIQKATSDVQKVVRAIKEEEKARADLLRAQQRSETAYALAMQRYSEEQAALQREQAERLKLEAMYDRNAVAARVYENAVNNLNRAEQLGVISADRKAEELLKLQNAYQQAGTSAARTSNFINQFGEGASVAGIKTNKFGMYAQQVGYQVGDFFVQIQSGTNAFVAFGQQATQLAGLLPGLAGAIVGIGISVATTFLAAWSRASEAMNNAADNAKRLEDGIKSLDQTVQDWLRTKKAAELGITVEELTGVSGIAEAEKALADARKEVEKFRDMMMSPGAAYGGTGLALAQALGIFGSENEVSAAEAKVVAAQNRLNLLRQKQAEDRRGEYLEEMRTLEQQVGLRERILRFGQDSLEVLREQNRIEKANYAQQVALTDLTERQKIDLIAANNAASDMALSNEVLQRGVAATNSLFENIANVVMENIKKANEENIEAQKNGFELVVKIKDELTAAAKVNLAKVFTDATGPAQTVLRTLNSFVENARIAAARIEYERKVGGGRGLGPQGPTNEELVRNVPEVQLAYGRLALTTPDTKGGTGSTGTTSTGLDAVQQLEQQIARTRELMRLSADQAALQEEIWRITDALGDESSRYSNQRIADIARENLALQEQQRIMEEAYERQQSIYDQMSSSMENAFMSIVEGTSSAKDAFRTMAYEVIKELYRVLVVQRLVGSFNATTGAGTGIVGFLGKAFSGGFAQGGAFIGGNVTAFANGGVVGSPTMFPMSGGRTGLMGEAGPEAIMPLKRTSSGKLGVVAEGGGAVNITQNFNISANGDESVKRIVMEQAPAIAKMTQSAVIDARRRGGQMKAAFG